GLSAGYVGLVNYEGWDEPELGWNMFEGFEGKGYAYEAAIAARDYAAQHFDLDGVISYIDPQNTRSLALAARLGATFEREGPLMGHVCHIYRHPKMGAK
ncbi:MAG: RimJ/RimL family protein N-acetyltransferase, partial [Planctomycetota bacterium]